MLTVYVIKIFHTLPSKNHLRFHFSEKDKNSQVNVKEKVREKPKIQSNAKSKQKIAIYI
jgi:hypothetical protein